MQGTDTRYGGRGTQFGEQLLDSQFAQLDADHFAALLQQPGDIPRLAAHGHQDTAVCRQGQAVEMRDKQGIEVALVPAQLVVGPALVPEG